MNNACSSLDAKDHPGRKNGRKDNARGMTEMIDPTTITWPKIIPLKMSAFSPLISAGNYIGDDR
jgi:hypothetical protein